MANASQLSVGYPQKDRSLRQLLRICVRIRLFGVGAAAGCDLGDPARAEHLRITSKCRAFLLIDWH
jgi:hypothetical protein